MAKNKWHFHGTDVSLEISLFEYGFIAAYNKADNDFFIVYKLDEGRFDTGYISESELDKLVNGESWMNEKDVNSFLATYGETKESWLKLPFVHKLCDLLNHYGYENLMGSTYWEGLTEEEVRAKYLN